MIAEVWSDISRLRSFAKLSTLVATLSAGLASIPWHVVLAVVVVGAYAGLIWWGLRDFGREA